MASEITLGIRMDWDNLSNKLNWFKPTAPQQLLPRDILKQARMLSGEEVDREVSKAVGKQPNATMGSTSSGWSSVSLFNGDTMKIGEVFSLGAVTSGTVSNVEQTRDHRNHSTETRVTYVTYDAIQ